MKKLIIILVLILLTSCQNFTKKDEENVRDYLLGRTELSEKQIEKYDLNDDGEISALDYLLIHKKLLEQNKLT